MLTASALLLLGVGIAWLFFGHQKIPNPDFAEFRRIGESVAAFELPTRARQGPLLGLTQVVLGKILGEEWTALEAGWLLNAILYPACILLTWLLLRRPLGWFAAPVCLLSFLNPWMVQTLVQPLAELPLQFLTLACLVLAVKRNKSCLILAALAGLVRWDGLALIPLCAIALLPSVSKPRAALLAIVASLPTGAWAGWCWHIAQTEGAPSYLEDVDPAARAESGAARFLVRKTETIVLAPLSGAKETTRSDDRREIRLLTRGLAVLLAGIGVAAAIRHRQRAFLLASLFYIPYAVFLTTYWIIPRYVSAFVWPLMALMAYGLISVLSGSWLRRAWVRGGSRVLLWTSLALLAWWGDSLLGAVSRVGSVSPPAVWVPILAASALLLIALDRLRNRQARPRSSPFSALEARIATIALCVTLVGSNQLLLARVLGDGHFQHEFRKLGSWLAAEDPESVTLVTRMPKVVSLFAPRHEENVVGLKTLECSNVEEVFASSTTRGFTHVALWGGSGTSGHPNTFSTQGNESLVRDPGAIGPWRLLQRFENLPHLSFVELWERTDAVGDG